MHPALRKLIPALAVAAPLALAAPAVASTDYGSDLNAVNDPSSLGCPAGGCTLVQTSFGTLPSNGVITRWRAKLNSGAQARLRVIENNYGDSYWPVADGPSMTGNGGVTSVDTRIPLNGGRYYAGIQLSSGSIKTDHYSGAETLGFSGTWNTGDWRQADGQGEHELLSQVTVEPDADGDGYGDETQDSCVFCSSGGNNSQSSGGGSGTDTYVPSYNGPSSADEESDWSKRPDVKLTLDKRGFFSYRDGKPSITVYWNNDGKKDLLGSLKLKWGKTTLKPVKKYPRDIDVDASDDGSGSNFKLPKSLVRKIERRGRAKLTATAKVVANTGAKQTVKQVITVDKAGLTNRYDGTYKGTGGLVIKVSGGYLTSIGVGLNTFCSASHKFMFRTLYTLGGFPTLIGRDGSFKAKGNNSPDSVRYEGTLKPRGTSKGYLSLFHTELGDDDGRLTIEQCVGASNWTAKRTGK